MRALVVAVGTRGDVQPAFVAERSGIGYVTAVYAPVALPSSDVPPADAVLAKVPATPRHEVFQTGAWVFDDDRPLPPELETFLAQGEAPIYVGFGSMPVASDASRAVIGAARALGRRLVLSRGWAELEALAPKVVDTARAFAGQLGTDGATVAARRLELEFE